MAFEGRNQDIAILKQKISAYNTPSTSRFLNIHARSGMGKTTLVKNLIDNLEKNPSNLEGIYEFKYADTSDCFSFEQVLLRIRMEFGNSADSFKDFDLLYILFYDYSEYKKIIAQDNFYQKLTNGNGSLKNRIKDFWKNVKSEKTIAKSVAVIIEIAVGCFALAKDQEIFSTIAGPILSAVNFETILAQMSSVIKSDSEFKEIQNIFDTAKSLDEYHRNRLLVNYFANGLNNYDNLTKRVIFVDNYNNRTTVDNEDYILGQNSIVTQGHAFWIFCSHNDLTMQIPNIPELKKEEHKLDILDREAVSALVDSLPNSSRLNPDNKNEIIDIIHKRSNGLPMKLVIFLKVLEQQLKENINNTPGKEEYYIEPDRFNGNFDDKEGLRFYFEMGKSDLEKDCFRILSCKEVWDENFYDIIRERIQLYLLNTRNLLENDSLIEEITDGKIKLHDEVRESLYDYENNIIKYDVIEIMYKYFLHQQEIQPIGDIDALQSFYTFALELCNGLRNHRFKHMNISEASAYKKFYLAFHKTIVYLDNHFLLSINSTKLYRLYDNIVTKYEEIVGKDEEYQDVLYNFGLYLYNIGKVSEASEIDKKYVRFINDKYGKNSTSNLSDALAYAKAYNAYAYDLSGLQCYNEANQYGQKSIEIAFRSLEETNDEPDYNNARHDIVQAIYTLDRTKDMREKEDPLSIIRGNFELLEQDSKTKDLFAQLLKTRGNMPWYWINIPEQLTNKWEYAINYGYNTWKLRESFYGENNQNTLTSMHNYAAYRIKCSSFALDKKLDITQKAIEKLLLDSLDTLNALMAKYVASTKFDKDICEAYHDSYDKIFKDTANMKNVFKEIDIKSLYSDKCFHKDVPLATAEEFNDFTLLYTNNKMALEAGQYISFAYYCLAKNTFSSKQNESIKYINKAILIGDQVLLGKIRLLGEKHKKTIETLNYTARYYILASQLIKYNREKYIENAKIRAKLSLDLLYGIKPSEIMQNEYEAVLKEADELNDTDQN